MADETSARAWYVASRSSGQGLVIEEGTGRYVAVAYEADDAPLIAAAPEMATALADLVRGATGAAVIARNEANARGDYAAPYVSQLTAAIEAGRAILHRLGMGEW